MNIKDITVNMADGKFNYRVGAIVIDSGEILMVKNSGMSFYYTVGGRIQFGESAQDAVLRESFEELNIRLEVDKLGFIHENFFVMDSSGERYHEVCLFFFMKPNALLREMKSNLFFKEEYGDVALHWLPMDNLKDYCIYPEFFSTELLNPPSEAKYIITNKL